VYEAVLQSLIVIAAVYVFEKGLDGGEEYVFGEDVGYLCDFLLIGADEELLVFVAAGLGLEEFELHQVAVGSEVIGHGGV
jgi:hypothetical protein